MYFHPLIKGEIPLHPPLLQPEADRLLINQRLISAICCSRRTLPWRKPQVEKRGEIPLHPPFIKGVWGILEGC